MIPTEVMIYSHNKYILCHLPHSLLEEGSLISYLVNREDAEGDCIETAELISSRQNNSIYLSFLDKKETKNLSRRVFYAALYS